MNTLIGKKPGELVYADTEIPLAKEGETMLKISRIGIFGTDLHTFSGTQPYFSYPCILRHEIAAEIVQTDREGFCQVDTVTINPYFHSVVIDATGSMHAINCAFGFAEHGAQYVLIGLQKGEISFRHPEFHKREMTLMSSRNATLNDFNFVMRAIESKPIQPQTFITHRVGFDDVKNQFPLWKDPPLNVTEAMAVLD